MQYAVSRRLVGSHSTPGGKFFEMRFMASEVIFEFKVAGNPAFSRSTNLESKLIEFFVFSAQSVFGSLQPFTVRKIGDFPHFLSALASKK